MFWLFCSSRHTTITVTSAISLLIGSSLGGMADGDAARFAADLRDPATQEQLLAEIEEADALGASGYPSLILVTETGRWPIQLDYREAGPMRDAIVMVLEATNA